MNGYNAYADIGNSSTYSNLECNLVGVAWNLRMKNMQLGFTTFEWFLTKKELLLNIRFLIDTCTLPQVHLFMHDFLPPTF